MISENANRCHSVVLSAYHHVDETMTCDAMMMYPLLVSYLSLVSRAASLFSSSFSCSSCFSLLVLLHPTRPTVRRRHRRRVLLSLRTLLLKPYVLRFCLFVHTCLSVLSFSEEASTHWLLPLPSSRLLHPRLEHRLGKYHSSSKDAQMLQERDCSMIA
mgnify:CR=1 FL=1